MGRERAQEVTPQSKASTPAIKSEAPVIEAGGQRFENMHETPERTGFPE